MGLTAGPFKPSKEWLESTPLISNHSFHRTAISNRSHLQDAAGITAEIKVKGQIYSMFSTCDFGADQICSLHTLIQTL